MRSRFALVAIALAACDAPHLPDGTGGTPSSTSIGTATANTATTSTTTTTTTATATSNTTATSSVSGGFDPPELRIVAPPHMSMDRRVTPITLEATAPGGGTLTVSRSGVDLSTTDIAAGVRATTFVISVDLVRGTNVLDLALQDPLGARAEASLTIHAGRPVAATLDTLYATDGDHLVAWGGGVALADVIPLTVPVTSIVAGQDVLAVVDAIGNVTTRIDDDTTVVSGASDVVTVAVGGGHTLALRADGSVLAWGANTRGQLGTGDTTASPTPVTVPGIDDVVAIAAAFETSFAVRRDGSMFVWGGNDKGMLGNGNEDAFAHPSPMIVPGLVDVVGVASGRGHVLSVDRVGVIRVWGNGSSGQLGNGASGILAFATQPVLIDAPEPVVDVAAKGNVSFAIGTSGALYAWGQNSSGQLGVGDTSVRTVPTATLLLGAIGVAPGSTSTIARDAAGSLFAWGSNASAQLGQPPPPNGPNLSSQPVELSWSP